MLLNGTIFYFLIDLAIQTSSLGRIGSARSHSKLDLIISLALDFKIGTLKAIIFYEMSVLLGAGPHPFSLSICNVKHV